VLASTAGSVAAWASAGALAWRNRTALRASGACSRNASSAASSSQKATRPTRLGVGEGRGDVVNRALVVTSA
jgi:hypothetical protein